MPRHATKLSKATLDSMRKKAEADPEFSTIRADGGCEHLYVRARRGAVRFLIRYRPPGGGGRRTLDLGRYGDLTLDQARAIAREHIVELARRLDPHEVVAEKARAARTFDEAIDGYLADLEARAKSGTGARGKLGGYGAMRGLLDKHARPALGKLPLRQVTPERVRALHRKVSKRTPPTANRLLTAISAVFGWAEREGWWEGTAPTKLVERNREDGQRRALTPAELERLGAVLNRVEAERGLRLPVKGKVKGKKGKTRLRPVHRSVILLIRLAALTGMRRSEISGLKWRDLDLDRGLVNLADTKAGKQQRVLGAAAVDLLKRARGRVADSDLVARGAGLSKARRALWQAAGIEDTAEGRADLHSLRHSFATLAVAAAHGRYVGAVSALLGHGHQVRQGITQRYISENPEALRPAADAIALLIASLLGLGEPGELVEFPRKASSG